MLRKKKGGVLRGGDDKTESTREDTEESWELVAGEKEELDQLLRKPPTQEVIEANMAAGQESWVVLTCGAMGGFLVSSNPYSTSILVVVRFPCV